MRKADKDVMALAATNSIVLGHPKEAELAMQLCKFTEMLEEVVAEMLPNRWDTQGETKTGNRRSRHHSVDKSVNHIAKNVLGDPSWV